MFRHCLFTLAVTAIAPVCFAQELVLGPPTWIVEAQIIESGGPLGEPEFTGKVLRWGESKQQYAAERMTTRGVRNGFRTQARPVFMLTSERITATLNTLHFSRLDGSDLKPAEIDELLKKKRAVAFLQKGTGISAEIAAALHPDTIVVTRVSYPADPVVISLPHPQ